MGGDSDNLVLVNLKLIFDEKIKNKKSNFLNNFKNTNNKNNQNIHVQLKSSIVAKQNIRAKKY